MPSPYRIAASAGPPSSDDARTEETWIHVSFALAAGVRLLALLGPDAKLDATASFAILVLAWSARRLLVGALRGARRI